MDRRNLSHYQILEKLGSGAMGDVFLAKDTKLDRNVALKVLPAALASEKRRRRFQQEAKAVAALNHPNIVQVYSVEEVDGIHFITMELVQGKSLAELIPRHGLTLEKFFPLAIELADAVSAAHSSGVIHRDLKPENLMVNGVGRLKILDFGISKLKSESGGPIDSESPTQSATQEGRIVGTFAYMSPEQAEGKSIDARSDIFSTGIVLHRMVTGVLPFHGDTGTAMVSSILKDTPPNASDVNPDVPRELARIIRRCLAKDVENRYQSAKDLRNDLKELQREIDAGELPVAGLTIPLTLHKWMLAPVLLALTIGAYLGLTRDVRPVDALEGTFTRLTSTPGAELFPNLSPGGEILVYAARTSGNWDIYTQWVRGETSFNLTADSPVDDTAPALSPDGSLIAFRSERDGGGIFVMGATGESVTRLTDFGYNPAWSPDGAEIVVAAEGVVEPSVRYSVSELWAVNVETGDRRLITEGDGVQPSWSPNGHRIAYWGLQATGGQRELWTIGADGNDPVQLTDDAHVDWNPVWSPDGEYLFFSSDRGGSMNIWRIPIDEKSGKARGEPEPVTTSASASSEHMSLTRAGGRMVYVDRVSTANLYRVAFDTDSGTISGELEPLTLGSNLVGEAAISPDQRFVAFRSFGKQEDLFVMAMDGTGRRQLTNDLYKDRRPTWSPDGKRIAFYSDRSGVYETWLINPDGSGLVQLTETGGWGLYPVWSPDGARLAYSDLESASFIIDVDTPWSDQTPEALPAFPGGDGYVTTWSWSPDGMRLAGTRRDAHGRAAGIIVYSLEAQQYEKLTDIGSNPRWLSDSRRLLFYAPGKLLLLDTASGEYHEVLAGEHGDDWTLSPDSTTIVLTLTRAEADVWLFAFN